MIGTFYIDDTLTFYVQTSRFTTGAAYDAAAAPTYRVYEQATDTPILTGSMALLDDANTTGLYAGSISLSAANGFEVGKCYCIRTAATVDSVAAAGIAAQFVVRGYSLDAVYAEPGSLGVAPTLGQALVASIMNGVNRLSRIGAEIKVYGRDGLTLKATRNIAESIDSSEYGAHP